MVLQLPLNQIHLLPGQRVQLEQISGAKFEAIFVELGEGDRLESPIVREL